MSERGEDGFTLVELLVAMTLGLLVLGAVLSIFETFVRENRATEKRADAQDRARIAIDGIERALRMPVGQVSGTAFQLDRGLPYDLAFRTFDPAAPSSNTPGLMRVRYCLDSTDPAAGRLVRQTQTWATAAPATMPSDTACPGTGWTSTTTLVGGVTNRRDGLDRPVWSIATATDGAVTTPTGVTTSLFVAVDPAAGARELDLTSAVALRNANRPPTAAFSATVGRGTTMLDGGSSQDPEGSPLRYAWTVNGTAAGSGQRIEAPVAQGSNAVQLTVTDSGDLSATASQTVVVP